jgi:hypothetical protein
MGSVIHLAAPLPAQVTATAVPAERVNYFVSRVLTAADFALQGRYILGRLLSLAPATTGVLTGLSVSVTPAVGQSTTRYDSPDGVTGLTGLTVGAGSGIGSDGRVVRVTAPITIHWSDLVAVVSSGSTIADGAYLLIARTVEYDGLDGPPPDPALRADPDPLLDIRQDSFVELWLSAPIAPLPPLPIPPAGVALAINTAIGDLTWSTLQTAIGNGVPLALVWVRNRQAVMLSQAAGRLPAQTHALNGMLLAQVREAIAMALAEPGADATNAAWQVALRSRFHFLPAAGELLVPMLLAPAATTASCPFFPVGVAVYLQFIRASQAAHLLYKALDRPPLDLADDNAPGVTLSLAVPDSAWSRDLIDIPRGDPVLAADLHLAYARARAAQVAWRQAWVALYGGIANPTSATQAAALGFLMAPDLAAQDLTYLLTQAPQGAITADDLINAADAAAASTDPSDALAALIAWINARIATLNTAGLKPPPPVAVPAPPTAAAAAQQLATLGYQVGDAEPPEGDPTINPHTPLQSDALLAPLSPSLPPNSAFTNWQRAILAAAPDPVLLQPLIEAGVFDANANADTRQTAINGLLAVPTTADSHPGALLLLAALQLFYAVFVRVTTAYEHLLNAHGRMLALQRQHLDMMSTYVSALAGGVPSNGSGLSFTRIIPFFDLQPGQASTPSPTAAPAPAALVTAARPAMTNLTATAGVGVRSISIGGSSTPAISNIATRLGSTTDIAQIVASEAGTLQQAPPFAYQPVQYGSAAHITSGATLKQISDTGLAALRQLMQNNLNLSAQSLPATTTTSGSAIDDETANYAAIVASTRALLGDMTQVENNAILVESAYFRFRDRIDSLQSRIAQVTTALGNARNALRNAQAAAAQSAGDYAAAQRLVIEETSRVAAAAAARNQAIAAATGLFFTRELQTILPRALPPALALTADAPADLVPGCPADHPGPPASLQPFLDLLLEVPLADWRSLLGAWTGLPDQAGLQRLGTLRAARLANWVAPTNFGAGAAATDLATLAQTTRSAFNPIFQSTISINTSLAATQQSAFAILALPDIVGLPASLLRTNTEALRARLESATGCLFETLTALPPSARFAWASLAAAKNLPLLNFAQWPLPAGLGDAGTATLRRLASLVNWMTENLHDASTSASQTALGNLVAAAVMAAAYGDPNEVVTGTVATTGGIPRPRIPIRVVLNRPPPIGTVLNLLDDKQSIVATIRVQDHDALGTTATVVTSYAQTTPTSGWSVASPTGRSEWLPS